MRCGCLSESQVSERSVVADEQRATNGQQPTKGKEESGNGKKEERGKGGKEERRKGGKEERRKGGKEERERKPDRPSGKSDGPSA